MVRSKALVSIGDIVKVATEDDGNYIGELINTIFFGSVGIVKILACTKYPSQRTIIYKFNNYERLPFIYGATETFPTGNIELFYGAIPEYYELMKTVFNNTFLIETEADKMIYERHKAYWERK